MVPWTTKRSLTNGRATRKIPKIARKTLSIIPTFAVIALLLVTVDKWITAQGLCVGDIITKPSASVKNVALQAFQALSGSIGALCGVTVRSTRAGEIPVTAAR
jgi:hypothetical protein